MSLDVLAEVNWLAVVVATIAYFLLGGVWYIAPPIATRWMRAGGIEIQEGQGPNPSVFVFTLLVYGVIVTATAMLAAATATVTAGGGAMLGGVVGGGFLVSAAAVSAIYDQKPEPLTYLWVNGVFNFVSLIIVGAILGAWQ